MANSIFSKLGNGSNGMFSMLKERMMSTMLPKEEDGLRISINGDVCGMTNTPDGKQWTNSKGELVMEEMLLDFNALTISRPVAQVKVGDIVKITKSTYGEVVSVDKGIVETITFGGEHRRAKAWTDALTKQAGIRVVINPLAGMIGGDAMNNGFAMLALMGGNDDDDKSDMLTLMALSGMMGGQGQNPMAALTSNPMALMMLSKGEGSNLKDLFMIQAMAGQGGNIFGNLFGTAPEAAPVQEDKTTALAEQVAALTAAVAQLTAANNKQD